MHTVILLGTPFFVSELRSLLAASSSIELKNYDGSSTVDGALYVYFGESKKDKARKYEKISLKKLAKEERIELTKYIENKDVLVGHGLPKW